MKNMEREIKFRAWTCFENKMYYNSYPNDFGEVLWYDPDQSENYTLGDYLEPFQIGEVKLMQFTGLKDKNGKDIYDGDIVKCHYFCESLAKNLGIYEEIIGEITFQEMGLWIQCEKEVYCGYLLWINGLHEESFEIIGNIYENPELLGETIKPENK